MNANIKYAVSRTLLRQACFHALAPFVLLASPLLEPPVLSKRADSDDVDKPLMIVLCSIYGYFIQTHDRDNDFAVHLLGQNKLTKTEYCFQASLPRLVDPEVGIALYRQWQQEQERLEGMSKWAIYHMARYRHLFIGHKLMAHGERKEEQDLIQILKKFKKENNCMNMGTYEW